MSRLAQSVLNQRNASTYIDKEQEIPWNREHIGLEDGVSQSSQGQRQIISGRLERDESHDAKLLHVRRDQAEDEEAYNVCRPQVNVLYSLPNTSQIHMLPVVHIAFRRIIAEDTIHSNLLFSLREPTGLAVKPCRSSTEDFVRLCDTGWHHQESHQPNDYTHKAFEQEPISRKLHFHTYGSSTHSHCQPDQSFNPRIFKKPAARRAPIICVNGIAVQNTERRMGSSLDL